jgi:hypothetical protein
MSLIKFSTILKTQFGRAIQYIAKYRISTRAIYKGAIPTLFFRQINIPKTPEITL